MSQPKRADHRRETVGDDHCHHLEPRVLLSSVEFVPVSELFDARLIQRLDALSEDVAAVAAAGDLDDDGIADYVLGLRDGDGRAFLRALSSATGETLWDSPAFDADTLGQFTAIGDLDDDGVADMAIGVTNVDGDDRGSVRLFSGADGSLLDTINADDALGGDVDDARFGSAIVGIGDVDNDGVDDLAIGAPGAFVDQRGAVAFLSGADRSSIGALGGSQAGQAFGSALALRNAGGTFELFVGSPGYDADTTGSDPDTAPDAGRVDGYDLSEGIPAERVYTFLGTMVFDAESAAFGAALTTALPNAAGAENLMIGVPGHVNGQGSIIRLIADSDGSLPMQEDGLVTRYIARGFDGERLGASLDRIGDGSTILAGLASGDVVVVDPRGELERSRISDGRLGVTIAGPLLAAPIADVDGDNLHEIVIVGATTDGATTIVVDGLPVRPIGDVLAIDASGEVIALQGAARRVIIVGPDGVHVAGVNLTKSMSVADVNIHGQLLINDTQGPVRYTTANGAEFADWPDVINPDLLDFIIGEQINDAGQVVFSGRTAPDVSAPAVRYFNGDFLNFLWQGHVGELTNDGVVVGTETANPSFEGSRAIMYRPDFNFIRLADANGTEFEGGAHAVTPDGRVLVSVTHPNDGRPAAYTMSLWSPGGRIDPLVVINRTSDLFSNTPLFSDAFVGDDGSFAISTWRLTGARGALIPLPFGRWFDAASGEFRELDVITGQDVFRPIEGVAVPLGLTPGGVVLVDAGAVYDSSVVPAPRIADGAEPRVSPYSGDDVSIAFRAADGSFATVHFDSVNGRWLVGRVTTPGGNDLDIGQIAGDPGVFNYFATGLAALVDTNGQLWLLERDATDRTRWALVANLSETTEAEPLTSDFAPIGVASSDQVFRIFARNTDGELVLFAAQDLPTGEWAFRNLVDNDLNGFNPQFVGPTTTWTTGWNAVNLAGVSESGEVITVWTTPALGGVFAYNSLSEVTASPVRFGADAALTAWTMPWGAMSVAGVDNAGQVQALWWTPALGTQWRTDGLTAIIQDAGPGFIPLQAGSIAAYTTPWNAQAIAGLDTDGRALVYWWSPATNEWRLSNLLEEAGLNPDDATNLFSGRISAAASFDGAQQVVATDGDGGLMRLSWTIASGVWALDRPGSDNPALPAWFTA